MQEIQQTQVWSLGQEDPLQKEMATHSSVCLENSMGRGAWWTTVQGGWKELDITEHIDNLVSKNTRFKSLVGFL